MEVVIVKLSSGEEILGEKVDAVHNGGVTIRNVLAIVLQPGQADAQGNQRIGFGFLPWGSLAGEDFRFSFKPEHVLYTATPVDEIKQMYAQRFGKIMTPPKGLLIAN